MKTLEFESLDRLDLPILLTKGRKPNFNFVVVYSFAIYISGDSRKENYQLWISVTNSFNPETVHHVQRQNVVSHRIQLTNNNRLTTTRICYSKFRSTLSRPQDKFIAHKRILIPWEQIGFTCICSCSSTNAVPVVGFNITHILRTFSSENTLKPRS